MWLFCCCCCCVACVWVGGCGAGVGFGLDLLAGWVGVSDYLLRFGYWCCGAIWVCWIRCLVTVVNSVGFDNSFCGIVFLIVWWFYCALIGV